jgi:hypothetical protein
VAADADHPSAPQRRDRPLLSLHELLLEVSRRPTRLELLCRQFNIEESRARPAWDVALRIKLLKAAGVDRRTGAKLFALTDRGRHALRELSGPPPRTSKQIETPATSEPGTAPSLGERFIPLDRPALQPD